MSTDTPARLEARATETTDASYTYHREPPAQGGKTYVRCTECGAELLTDLGGKRSLVHRENCSQADEVTWG